MDSTDTGKKKEVTKEDIDNEVKRKYLYERVVFANLPKKCLPIECTLTKMKEADFVNVEWDNIKIGQAMLIQGSQPGCGKTFLACAIGKQYIKDGLVVKYLPIDIYVEMYRNKDFDEIESILDRAAVIIWDDLRNKNYTDWERNLIAGVLRKRLEYMSRPDVIVTSILESQADTIIGQDLYKLITRNSSVISCRLKGGK